MKESLLFKTIWERYILSEILKVYFLFLGCFFFLYSILDYSLHMQDFLLDDHIQLSHLIPYYCYQFIKYAYLLIPLALLIATLKVLFSMNTKSELVALQVSGLSAKKILRPFFFVALLSTLFNLLSAEFLLPSSLHFLDRFRNELHLQHRERDHRKEPLHVIPLKDRSKIVYQTEDKDKELFVDVFWIRSTDDIWRMKYLSTNPHNPIGYYVDHLVRSPQGSVEKTESFTSHLFPAFPWENDLIGKGHIPTENRKMSTLWRLLLHRHLITDDEYAQVLSHFLYKCLIPFFSILVVLAGAPFCLRYSRSLPVFFTYALSLFAFIGFTALLDALLILGENRILSPYIAILIPFGLCACICSWKFKKECR